MAICDQLTFDLMGVDENAYEDLFGGLNEDGLIELFLREKNWGQLHILYQKRKYVKYMCGDMDEALKHYELYQEVTSISQNTGEYSLSCHWKCALLCSNWNSELCLPSPRKSRASFAFLRNDIH